jgi:hypothetical protein
MARFWPALERSRTIPVHRIAWRGACQCESERSAFRASTYGHGTRRHAECRVAVCRKGVEQDRTKVRSLALAQSGDEMPVRLSREGKGGTLIWKLMGGQISQTATYSFRSVPGVRLPLTRQNKSCAPTRAQFHPQSGSPDPPPPLDTPSIVD